MRQLTKKQLRDKIELLQHDLYKAINKLPASELKKELSEKYPFWFSHILAEKYGKSYRDNLLDLLNENKKNGNNQSYWFEKQKTTI